MLKSCRLPTHLAKGLLLIATILSPLANSASAYIVISNTPNTVVGGSSLSNTIYKAIVFSTGSYPSNITSLELGLNPSTGSTLPFTGDLNISLWSATSNASEYEPVTQLASTGMQSVTINSTQNLYTFEGIFDGFSLLADTPYALVLSSNANGIKWGRNANSTPLSSDGFIFHDFSVSTDSGASWTSPSALDNAIVMEIAVIPEPSTALMSLFFFGAATAFWLLRKQQVSAH
ncbi:MAG: hypothetical protein ACO3ZW_07310 [Opitutales bacterium]